MVNKYKRKSDQGLWSEIAMKKAMQEVTELNKAIKTTATKYGIPRATLQRHLKSGSCIKKLGRFTSVFSEKQEQELLDYIFQMDSVFYGLSKEEFLLLVFQYAEKNRIPHPFKDGTAGTDWYKGFVRRHPDLTLRKPEPTSIARARGFNKPQVYRFFDILEEQIQKHDMDATRFYNMDETGVQTSSNKPPRVLTKVGKRQVGLIASSERGRTTTVVCCCNAAGAFIPPFMIFARKKMNSRLLDGAAPGTQGTCTDNGWINGPAFLEWLGFFVETVRPKSDKKVILVLDNHESHKYLPALEFASAHNVIFISLAPHTTHRMQPLDYCVYGPLKVYFEQAIASYQKAHAGRIINQNDIAGIFSSAYVKAATAQNAINGFKTTGIYPTNRYIFDESEFAPSSVTERPLNQETEELEKRQPEVIDPQPAGASTPTADPVPLITDNSSEVLSLEELPESSTTEVAPILDTLINKLQITPVKRVPLNDITDSATSFELDNVPSTSTVHFTPMAIRPLPKVCPNKTNRRRQPQKAEILTSTPIKEDQRLKLLKKNKSKNETLKKITENLKENLKSEKKGKKIEKPKKKTNEKKKRSGCPCLICGELYEDPPTEDWIQCDDCKMWAHDECTSYSGIGAFFCDYCHEI